MHVIASFALTAAALFAVSIKAESHLAPIVPEGEIIEGREELLADISRPPSFASLRDRGSLIAFSPDGKFLVSTLPHDRSVHLWDIASGREVLRLSHTSSIISVAASPTTNILASTTENGIIWLWNTATGELIQRLRLLENFADGMLPETESATLLVAFNADGDVLASASQDGSVRLWDIEKGKVTKQLEGLAGIPFSVEFSPDGSTVASAFGDGTIRLWDVATGKTKRVFEVPGVISLAFNVDGFLALSSRDGTIRLWDTVTGKRLRPSNAILAT